MMMTVRWSRGETSRTALTARGRTWSMRKPNSRPTKTLHAAPAVAKSPSGSRTAHGGTASLQVGCWYLSRGRRHE